MNRYEIRHNNGRYKLFDTVDYRDLAAFMTRQEAEAALSLIQ
jgi:hypothetical protein